LGLVALGLTIGIWSAKQVYEGTQKFTFQADIVGPLQFNNPCLAVEGP